MAAGATRQFLPTTVSFAELAPGLLRQWHHARQCIADGVIERQASGDYTAALTPDPRFLTLSRYADAVDRNPIC
jgi:hypothetical protein